MPQKHPTLWHIREQHGITRDLIQRFKQKAIATGQSPTAALAALLRRELGDDEPGPAATPQATR
jgi:hypothetical protein